MSNKLFKHKWISFIDGLRYRRNGKKNQINHWGKKAETHSPYHFLKMLFNVQCGYMWKHGNICIKQH